MKINWIEVENFKGFDKRRFEFDEHFTLIVGENGTGKTTAVEMVRQLLGAWCACAGHPHSEHPRDILRMETSILASGAVTSFVLPLKFKVSYSGVVFDSEVMVTAMSEADAPGIQNYLQESFHSNINPFINQMDFSKIYPVCVCYPARRTFEHAGPEWNQIMAANLFRSDGYSLWDRPNNIGSKLAEWMGRQEAIAFETKKEAPSYTSVKTALQSAIPECSKVWFSAQAGQLLVEWENGTRIGYSNLSDGQRSILTMVGDIARRAALLNPHLDNPAAETPGVVVIDEIDLHLHPRWQRQIMEDLRRTFPKIQFIATTHSPIIISAAKDAKVIQLLPDGLREFPQAYGMDLNWIVEELQGGEARPHEVSKLISQAKELIEEGALEKARETVQRIKTLQNGDAPDSIELESSIDNLIALAHAED